MVDLLMAGAVHRRSIACHFALGVSSTTPSTPGVFLPRFEVTRLTARSLAAIERVSRFWSFLIKRHLPAFVAFTIRVWSRRTAALARRQLTRCQGESICASAILSLSSACQIVLPFPTFSCILTYRKWAPFRVGHKSYPTHYRPAFAFSGIPYPLTCRYPLRGACYILVEVIG